MCPHACSGRKLDNQGYLCTSQLLLGGVLQTPAPKRGPSCQEKRSFEIPHSEVIQHTHTYAYYIYIYSAAPAKTWTTLVAAIASPKAMA